MCRYYLNGGDAFRLRLMLGDNDDDDEGNDENHDSKLMELKEGEETDALSKNLSTVTVN